MEHAPAHGVCALLILLGVMVQVASAMMRRAREVVAVPYSISYLHHDPIDHPDFALG